MIRAVSAMTKRRAGWFVGWGLCVALSACDSRGGAQQGEGVGGLSAGGSGAALTDAAVVESDSAVELTVDAASEANASVAAPDASSVALAPVAVVGIVLQSLRFRPTAEARGADAQVDLELREDGAIARRGAVIARFEGERVIDARGREVLRLASDRVVMIAGLRTAHRLTDQGDLRRADGRVLHVEDDGRVSMLSPDGARDSAPMRVEGFRPAARATASLLCVYLALQP
jgi:hypothetical protein